MFKNITELLDKLKLIREVIQTKDLGKLGDLLAEAVKLINFGDFGAAGNLILHDAIAHNWSKLTYDSGSLLQLISTKIPSSTSQPVIGGFAWNAVPTMGPTPSDTPKLDMLIHNIETYCTTANSTLGTYSDGTPVMSFPPQVWTLLLQAGFEVLQYFLKK